MEINLTASYILRILFLLGRAPDRTYNRYELHRELEIPLEYVPKVMKVLIEHVIVGSVIGRNGGYRMLTDLKHISLFDIISWSTESTYPRLSFQGEKESVEICRAYKFCMDLQEHLNNELKNMTLDKLL